MARCARTKTQVAIIGGGPSGLLLSQLLNRAGVETVVLERAARDHVLSRIRAGMLEAGTTDMLREAGVADRMAQDGIAHGGCYLADDDLMVRINFRELTGTAVTVYGQTEVTADLYAAQDAIGATILHGVEDVAIQGADSSAPCVTSTRRGMVAGMDDPAGNGAGHGPRAGRGPGAYPPDPADRHTRVIVTSCICAIFPATAAPGQSKPATPPAHRS